VYCSHLSCYQVTPCAIHGTKTESQPLSFFDKVRGRAASVTDSIKEAFSRKDDKVHVQGEEIIEVKTHSLEEAVMHKPTAGQDGVASATVKTEYDTAHTWEQQHEGGLGHRAKETARGAVEAVGEKASAAADVIKERASAVQGSLAETGHNTRVKVDESLDRNFGGTAEKIHAEAHRVKENLLEDAAHDTELAQGQLGAAATTLHEKESIETRKTEATKLNHQAHTDSTVSNVADKMIVEGQQIKEDAIHSAALVADDLEHEAGNAASSLREQQRAAQAHR